MQSVPGRRRPCQPTRHKARRKTRRKPPGRPCARRRKYRTTRCSQKVSPHMVALRTSPSVEHRMLLSQPTPPKTGPRLRAERVAPMMAGSSGADGQCMPTVTVERGVRDDRNSDDARQRHGGEAFEVVRVLSDQCRLDEQYACAMQLLSTVHEPRLNLGDSPAAGHTLTHGTGIAVFAADEAVRRPDLNAGGRGMNRASTM